MKRYVFDQERLVEVDLTSVLAEKERQAVLMTPEEFMQGGEYCGGTSMFLRQTDPSDYSRVDVFEKYIHLHIDSIRIESQELVLYDRMVDIYLCRESIVIVRSDGDNHIDDMFQRMTEETETKFSHASFETAALMEILLENIVGLQEKALDALEKRIVDLEDYVYRTQGRDVHEEIVSLRKFILRLKRRIEPSLFIVGTLLENEADLFDVKMLRHLKVLDNRTAHLFSEILFLNDYISQIREAYEAERDIYSNELMKVFTVITSIFLPLTLLAGWYGMNFKSMPEIYWKYGYFYVFILSLLIVGGMLIFFKRKRWM